MYLINRPNFALSSYFVYISVLFLSFIRNISTPAGLVNISTPAGLVNKAITRRGKSVEVYSRGGTLFNSYATIGGASKDLGISSKIITEYALSGKAYNNLKFKIILLSLNPTKISYYILTSLSLPYNLRS